MDVERLIGEDHPARSIWTLVGRLDLSSFYRGIESSTEEGGRPAFDPQLPISLWVYITDPSISNGDFFFCKTLDWSNEEEVRLVARRGQGPKVKLNDPLWLNRIILGKDMTDANRQQIREWAK